MSTQEQIRRALIDADKYHQHLRQYTNGFISRQFQRHIILPLELVSVAHFAFHPLVRVRVYPFSRTTNMSMKWTRLNLASSRQEDLASKVSWYLSNWDTRIKLKSESKNEIATERCGLLPVLGIYRLVNIGIEV